MHGVRRANKNCVPPSDQCINCSKRVAQWQSAAPTRQRRRFNSFRAYQIPGCRAAAGIASENDIKPTVINE